MDAFAFCSRLMLGGRVWRLFSALRAGVLSFASPKESSQRKGDPRVSAGRCPVPCATRQSGRLAKLACGSDNASRQPPDSLRCSAPLMGTREASWNDGSAQEGRCAFLNARLDTAKNEYFRFFRDAFRVPMEGAEQRRNAGGSRLALSEPQASLASRPAFRVAQGTRRAPTLGSPFLWLLSFGEAKESTPARKAEPHAHST